MSSNNESQAPHQLNRNQLRERLHSRRTGSSPLQPTSRNTMGQRNTNLRPVINLDSDDSSPDNTSPPVPSRSTHPLPLHRPTIIDLCEDTPDTPPSRQNVRNRIRNRLLRDTTNRIIDLDDSDDDSFPTLVGTTDVRTHNTRTVQRPQKVDSGARVHQKGTRSVSSDPLQTTPSTTSRERSIILDSDSDDNLWTLPVQKEEVALSSPFTHRSSNRIHTNSSSSTDRLQPRAQSSDRVHTNSSSSTDRLQLHAEKSSNRIHTNSSSSTDRLQPRAQPSDRVHANSSSSTNPPQNFIQRSLRRLLGNSSSSTNPPQQTGIRRPSFLEESGDILDPQQETTVRRPTFLGESVNNPTLSTDQTVENESVSDAELALGTHNLQSSSNHTTIASSPEPLSSEEALTRAWIQRTEDEISLNSFSDDSIPMSTGSQEGTFIPLRRRNLARVHVPPAPISLGGTDSQRSPERPLQFDEINDNDQNHHEIDLNLDTSNDEGPRSQTPGTGHNESDNNNGMGFEPVSLSDRSNPFRRFTRNANNTNELNNNGNDNNNPTSPVSAPASTVIDHNDNNIPRNNPVVHDDPFAHFMNSSNNDTPNNIPDFFLGTPLIPPVHYSLDRPWIARNVGRPQQIFQREPVPAPIPQQPNSDISPPPRRTTISPHILRAIHRRNRPDFERRVRPEIPLLPFPQPRHFNQRPLPLDLPAFRPPGRTLFNQTLGGNFQNEEAALFQSPPQNPLRPIFPEPWDNLNTNPRRRPGRRGGRRVPRRIQARNRQRLRADVMRALHVPRRPPRRPHWLSDDSDSDSLELDDESDDSDDFDPDLMALLNREDSDDSLGPPPGIRRRILERGGRQLAPQQSHEDRELQANLERAKELSMADAPSNAMNTTSASSTQPVRSMIEVMDKEVEDRWNAIKRGTTYVEKNKEPYADKDLEIIMNFLSNQFKECTLAELERAWREHTDLLKVYVALKKRLQEDHTAGGQRRRRTHKRNRREKHVAVQEASTRLQEEFQIPDFILQVEKKIDEKTKQKENEVSNKISLSTCGTCFDEEIVAAETVKCSEGHSFCMSCIRTFADTSFGAGLYTISTNNLGNVSFEEVTILKCPEMGGCEKKGIFTDAVLAKCMTEENFNRYSQRSTALAAAFAGVGELVECPFCDFVVSMPNEEDHVVVCLNPLCLKKSCRKCKYVSHLPQRCDEVERDWEVEIRTQVEEAVSNAVSLLCPKCKVKIEKIDGCNHMTCKCKCHFCYLCETVIDKSCYEMPRRPGDRKGPYHFGEPRSGKCPQFGEISETKQKKRIEKAMEAGKKAIELFFERHPEQRGKKLKVDPLVGIEKNLQDTLKRNQQSQRRELQEAEDEWMMLGGRFH